MWYEVKTCKSEWRSGANIPGKGGKTEGGGSRAKFPENRTVVALSALQKPWSLFSERWTNSITELTGIKPCEAFDMTKDRKMWRNNTVTGPREERQREIANDVSSFERICTFTPAGGGRVPWQSGGKSPPHRTIPVHRARRTILTWLDEIEAVDDVIDGLVAGELQRAVVWLQSVLEGCVTPRHRVATKHCTYTPPPSAADCTPASIFTTPAPICPSVCTSALPSTSPTRRLSSDGQPSKYFIYLDISGKGQKPLICR